MDDPSQPYFATSGRVSDTGSFAELMVEGRNTGFGISGLWGAGAGVPDPEGKTVRERAEVWFDKVSAYTDYFDFYKYLCYFWGGVTVLPYSMCNKL